MLKHLSYNDYGLAIGLISYSFKVDGKGLFRDVFEDDLFKNHRENLTRYTNESLDEYLYQPKGYRLFGNHGIAVLSLIDDYAFCNRIFNDNHTHGSKVEDKETQYKWGAKVITGVGEGCDYLYRKSQETFLRRSERYPFIGIMKLKIDHKLLYGKGIEYTNNIKKVIEAHKPIKCDCQLFDYIVVDCFDNDEMAVIAFSNSMSTIHEFMENIRELKDDMVRSCAHIQEPMLFDCKPDKHIFTSCHISLGYDVDCHIGTTEHGDSISYSVSNRQTFQSVSNRELVSDAGSLNFICEAKPGHQAELLKQINAFIDKKRITIFSPINTSITGGSVIHTAFPIRYIFDIEALCQESTFTNHIRRVKISLRTKDSSNKRESNIGTDHDYASASGKIDTPFDRRFIKQMKERLNKCGVSKSVRERLLSLYHLYNESAGNLLHAAYLKELEAALKSEETVLENFLDDELRSVKKMDMELSNHILAFEEAFYNRFHDKGLSSNNLEYNGSVQQYLTCFDFLYKQLHRIINPPADRDAYKTVFTSITGHERVSSTRRNLQLNINQITYPEFFATTVWKEAFNHKKSILEELPQPERGQKDAYERFAIWKEFATEQASFDKIRFFLDSDSLGRYRDRTFMSIHKRLDRELLEYFIADQIVFHFGFQRDFELYWHFYWKTFLQTSTVYMRKGEVNREVFIEMLLRLYMVAENNLSYKDQDEICKPYDSSIANLWMTCNDKVHRCAKSIFKTLNIYGFAQVCEDMIYLMEEQLSHMTPYLKVAIQKSGVPDSPNETNKINRYINGCRQYITSIIFNTLSKRNLIVPDDTISESKNAASPDFAISLLHAFMKEVMYIDNDRKKDTVIRSVPRNSDGEKQPFIKDQKIAERMINMPADPLGGVLIPDFSVRKRYFSARTTLYRTLWHYKMISETITT